MSSSVAKGRVQPYPLQPEQTEARPIPASSDSFGVGIKSVIRPAGTLTVRRHGTGPRFVLLEGAAEIGEPGRYHGAFARERLWHLLANEGQQLFPDFAAEIPGLRRGSGADQRP